MTKVVLKVMVKKFGAKIKKLNTIEIVARILGELIEEDNIRMIHIEIIHLNFLNIMIKN